MPAAARAPARYRASAAWSRWLRRQTHATATISPPSIAAHITNVTAGTNVALEVELAGWLPGRMKAASARRAPGRKTPWPTARDGDVGKTASSDLEYSIRRLYRIEAAVVMFECTPGEFQPHDFGEADVSIAGDLPGFFGPRVTGGRAPRGGVTSPSTS
jgi:hypothetical protein